MRFPAIALLSLLSVVSADAQPVPAGSGLIVTKEKLKIGNGCASFSGADNVALSILPGGTWTAQATAGDFSGTLTPADPNGRSWNIQFDGPSLAFYELYLEDAASNLCGAAVSISNGLIETFVLKFGKDGTQVSLQLKTSASGSTIYGAGQGKHQIKGKGSFAPAP